MQGGSRCATGLLEQGESEGLAENLMRDRAFLPEERASRAHAEKLGPLKAR